MAPRELSALKFTVLGCREKKLRGEKISCLTAYDFPFARFFDEAGIDVLLVGDSLGMVIAGEETTLPVTLEQILWATRAARRGARRALVVADMPFGSYQVNDEEAVRNALRLVKEAGAEAVKLEGGRARAGLVRRLVAAEIPVLGHIGLTPQSVNRLGGFRVQGRDEETGEELLADAAALEAAGAFAVVLEGIPRELAARITAAVGIATIGIGAGPDCDGQILVLHDLLGLSSGTPPKFVRPFADLGARARAAAEAYRHEVEAGVYPSDQESYHLGPVIAAARRARLK